MKRSHVALLLGVAVAGALTIPAFGGTTLTTKVRRLTHLVDGLAGRVDGVSRAQALSQTKTVHTHVQFAFTSTDPSGTASGTATCPPGMEASGGGAQFIDAQVGDTLIYSRPAGEVGATTAWQAAARKANGAPGRLEIYVVCIDFGF